MGAVELRTAGSFFKGGGFELQWRAVRRAVVAAAHRGNIVAFSTASVGSPALCTWHNTTLHTSAR